MRRQLRAGTHMEHRKDFRERIDGQPQPEHLCMVAQACAQFIQLQMREVEVAEEMLVQRVCVPACTREPPRNRGVSKAEDPRSRRRVQPFGQRREHHGDLVRGGFQTVQGRVASSAERGAARRTSKRLDRFSAAMLAIADQGVDVSFSVPEVRATLGWDKRTLRCRCVWGLPVGFSPRARDAPAQSLTFHLTRRWWRDGRRGNRLGCGA